jgi:hypothetical protein
MTSIALQNVGHPVVFHLFCKGIHEDDIDKLGRVEKLDGLIYMYFRK